MGREGKRVTLHASRFTCASSFSSVCASPGSCRRTGAPRARAAASRARDCAPCRAVRENTPDNGAQEEKALSLLSRTRQLAGVRATSQRGTRGAARRASRATKRPGVV